MDTRTNKNILKEFNDYCSIFLFFVIIFLTFSNNMTFSANCYDYNDKQSEYYRNTTYKCRNNDEILKAISKDGNISGSLNESLDKNKYTDEEGNIPLTCNISDINYVFPPYQDPGENYKPIVKHDLTLLSYL